MKVKYPYHYDPVLNRFYKHEWHYLLFHSFAWYRRLVGGIWEYVQPDPNCEYRVWMRMREVEEIDL